MRAVAGCGAAAGAARCSRVRCGAPRNRPAACTPTIGWMPASASLSENSSAPNRLLVSVSPSAGIAVRGGELGELADRQRAFQQRIGRMHLEVHEARACRVLAAAAIGVSGATRGTNSGSVHDPTCFQIHGSRSWPKWTAAPMHMTGQVAYRDGVCRSAHGGGGNLDQQAVLQAQHAVHAARQLQVVGGDQRGDAGVWIRCSSSSNTCAAVCGSRLPVGSSASSSRGALASARAIAVRCCSPPDSCAGR